MAKFEFLQWLVTFFEASDFFVFQWDSGNALKSEEKHGVTVEQIESCFQDDKIMVLGIQISPPSDEERYGILAKDLNGEVIFICFTIREGKIRPISGRYANKKERDMYEA